MVEGLTAQERFLRRIEALAFSAIPIDELPLSAAAPQHHDGVMVALVPDDPERLAVDHPEALPADDLHITLCYFGKIQDLSNADQTKILTKTRSVCDAVGASFEATADGVIIMGKNDDGVPATALLVQSQEIVDLYEALAEGLDYTSDYPSFIPHMTAGYGVPVEDVKHVIGEPITFSNVIVKFGDAVHNVPLPSAMVAAPRSANVIDRVIDSLGRMWDEALHPRDGEGKFIKKNGAVSGKLAVPTADRKNVTMVDANRASVVGFHTFNDEVWVLAEITDKDGSTTQGFARAANVRAVAPVKARLDALYPVDDRGDAFINSSLERKRQLDLILAHINSEYGPDDDEGALAFVETLGLWEKDLDYIWGGGDTDFLGGIRKVDGELDDDEMEEQESIIEDARSVKKLRDRVHGLKEDPDFGFSADDAHVSPQQELLTGAPSDPKIIEALQNGEDPLTLKTDNLLGAMYGSGRYEKVIPRGKTGVSPIEWLIDHNDPTGNPVWLAGASRTSSDRAFFVKQSIIGAEMSNTDIVNEVAASLMAEHVATKMGNDKRLLKIPRSVFGDNPEWDEETPPKSFDLDDMSATHQPGHVISQHAEYLIPADWSTTSAQQEETSLRNDIRSLDEASQVDQREAFYEDVGDIYGNSITKMVLWDFVLLNSDRNPGNAILATSAPGAEGVVIPIDHGFAFDDLLPVDKTAEWDGSFTWFMNYVTTRAWLNYVRGGLALNQRVTEDSLRRSIQDFADTYGRMDAEQIIDSFRTLPGVTQEQIALVEQGVTGAVDRARWIVDNIDTVLQTIVEGTS